MVKKDINSVEFIYCACGCQKTRPKYSKHGINNISKYIKGHNRRELKKPTEYIKCGCGCGETRLRYDRSGYEHKFIHGHNAKGETHPSYIHGQCLSKYKKINVDSKQYEEHRYIYEQHYSVCVLPWCIVHHINEDPHDNRIENLMTMTRAEHCLHHHKRKDMSDRYCHLCSSKTTDMRKYNNGSLYALWIRDKLDQEKRWMCKRCYDRRRGH